MNTPAPEFLIDDVVEAEDLHSRSHSALLIGRCGDGPIRKGHVFLSAYCYSPGRYPHAMGEAPSRSEEIPVRLEVAEIQTHNRSLELLGQGMTGAVLVRGDGVERLGAGWVVGQPAATFVGREADSIAPKVVSFSTGN